MLLAAALLLAGVVPSSIAGRQLYDLRCASCHGMAARGTSLAPSLLGDSAADVHLMLDTGRMPAASAGSAEIARPPQFDEAQMRAIVAFVLHFSPGADTSLPHVIARDSVRGRMLFAENCAHCHGPDGNGGSIGFADVAPSLMYANLLQIGEAIRAGPGQMPRFGPRVLTSGDVDDIAAYVKAVQTNRRGARLMNQGGTPLAHIGPVAEGFFAWVFGIGALLVFIRLIGSTQ